MPQPPWLRNAWIPTAVYGDIGLYNKSAGNQPTESMAETSMRQKAFFRNFPLGPNVPLGSPLPRANADKELERAPFTHRFTSGRRRSG